MSSMTKQEVEQFVDDMIRSIDQHKLMVDPPAGWRYGFPKAYPKEKVGSNEELNEWLLANGYPQKEIDSCGDYFPVRFWYAE